MDEADPGQVGTAAAVDSAGALLKAARERQGLSLAEVGTRTRVPLRHLAAIETGDYNALPSPTYAVGFGKAYARAVGADEVAVASSIRDDISRLGRRQPEYTPYEIADPARVPSRGVAIVGAGVALAILILVALWYGSGLLRGGGRRPAAEPSAAPTMAAAPTPAFTPPATGGQVRLAATDQVWLRVYDATGKTLYEGNMKPGDTFDVPAAAADPRIDVGRPDKLTVTLNGSVVPPLGSGAAPVKAVPVSGGAIAARLNGQPTPAATARPPATAPAAGPAAQPATPAAPHAAHPAARKPAAKHPAKPPRRHLTETQRANLESAAHPPPAEPAP